MEGQGGVAGSTLHESGHSTGAWRTAKEQNEDGKSKLQEKPGQGHGLREALPI